MKMDPKRDHYVILATEHKRQKDGPAVISLTQELKCLLDIYVQKIRSQIPGPKDDYVFLNNA